MLRVFEKEDILPEFCKIRDLQDTHDWLIQHSEVLTEDSASMHLPLPSIWLYKLLKYRQMQRLRCSSKVTKVLEHQKYGYLKCFRKSHICDQKLVFNLP